MLIIFTLPPIIYHKLVQKLLKYFVPLLEQLDQSMEYKRRTLIDRKDLLVQVNTPGLNEQNDDDDVESLRQQQQEISSNQRLSIIDEEDTESNQISFYDQSQSLFSKQTITSEASFDILCDSTSSSIIDDETNPVINQLYASMTDSINGKQRIRIKSSGINLQRKSQMNKIPADNSDLNIRNASGEPDLTSFDFLNDYDEK